MRAYLVLPAEYSGRATTWLKSRASEQGERRPWSLCPARSARHSMARAYTLSTRFGVWCSEVCYVACARQRAETHSYCKTQAARPGSSVKTMSRKATKRKIRRAERVGTLCVPLCMPHFIHSHSFSLHTRARVLHAGSQSPVSIESTNKGRPLADSAVVWGVGVVQQCECQCTHACTAGHTKRYCLSGTAGNVDIGRKLLGPLRKQKGEGMYGTRTK